MSEEVYREERLSASPKEVWELVADPAELSAWFGARIEGNVESGSTLTIRWPDGAESRALVEIVEPVHRLVFRWLPLERAPDGRTRRREPSRVAIDLEPYEGATVLRVTETRVGSAGTPRPDIGFRPLARR